MTCVVVDCQVDVLSEGLPFVQFLWLGLQTGVMVIVLTDLKDSVRCETGGLVVELDCVGDDFECDFECVVECSCVLVEL